MNVNIYFFIIDSNQFYRKICLFRTNDIISSDTHNLRDLISHTTSMKNEKNVKSDEMLKMLKEGQIFIKYGNKGTPHKRLVQLSLDGTKILWRKMNSCNIFKRNRSINVADVRIIF